MQRTRSARQNSPSGATRFQKSQPPDLSRKTLLQRQHGQFIAHGLHGLAWRASRTGLAPPLAGLLSAQAGLAAPRALAWLLLLQDCCLLERAGASPLAAGLQTRSLCCLTDLLCLTDGRRTGQRYKDTLLRCCSLSPCGKICYRARVLQIRAWHVWRHQARRDIQS